MTGDVEILAKGLRFPEGPIALPDGSVLVVEIAGGTLRRIAPDGKVEVVAECGGGPNGAAIGPDGAVYVCNNGGQDFIESGDRLYIGPVSQAPAYETGSIQRVDLSTGEITTLYTECDGNRLRSPNDIVFDRSGGFWFTDQGKTRERDRDWGGLYYAQADASSIREVLPQMDTPNGVGLSPDESRLYVSETMPGRVWWWPLRAPGEIETDATPGRGRVLLSGPGRATFFDSLAVEADGTICVATLFRGGITTITPDGDEDFISVPDRLTTNLCFAGEDMMDAYLTLSSTGRVAKMRWPRPGLKLAF